MIRTALHDNVLVNFAHTCDGLQQRTAIGNLQVTAGLAHQQHRLTAQPRRPPSKAWTCKSSNSVRIYDVKAINVCNAVALTPLLQLF